MIEFVDAKKAKDLSRWLKKIELLREREIQVLIIRNYHCLISQFQLVDEFIQDWFPNVIGMSSHLCFGKSKVFFWQGWPFQFHFRKHLCPIFLGAPSLFIPSLGNHLVNYRFGCFVFYQQKQWRLYNGWNAAWKSLIYYAFFVIFEVEYANQNSRSPIE